MRRQEVYVDYHGREYIPVHFSPDATVYLKHRSEINAGINNCYGDEITFNGRLKHVRLDKTKGDYAVLRAGTLMCYEDHELDYSNPIVYTAACDLAQDYPHIAVKNNMVVGYWDTQDKGFKFETAFNDFAAFLSELCIKLMDDDFDLTNLGLAGDQI